MMHNDPIRLHSPLAPLQALAALRAQTRLQGAGPAAPLFEGVIGQLTFHTSGGARRVGVGIDSLRTPGTVLRMPVPLTPTPALPLRGRGSVGDRAPLIPTPALPLKGRE
jgi:hypothetical protein